MFEANNFTAVANIFVPPRTDASLDAHSCLDRLWQNLFTIGRALLIKPFQRWRTYNTCGNVLVRKKSGCCNCCVNFRPSSDQNNIGIFCSITNNISAFRYSFSAATTSSIYYRQVLTGECKPSWLASFNNFTPGYGSFICISWSNDREIWN